MNFILFLSVVGLLNSFYLTYLKLFSLDHCLSGQSCLDVINSAYGSILTMPTSYLGVIFFSIVIILSLLIKQQKGSSLFLLIILSSVGSLFSLIFIGIQFFILKSFCLFCTFSALLTFLITGLISTKLIRDKAPSFSFNITKTEFKILFYTVGAFLLLHYIPYFITEAFTITIQPKYVVKSSFKKFTLNEINELTGFKIYQQNAERYDTQKNALINYLARKDATDLGVSLDQYFKIFVETQLSIFDKNIRLKVKNASSDPKKLESFLKNEVQVPKMIHSSRFENLKIDLLKKFNVTLNLSRDFQINIKQNPLDTIQFGDTDAPINVVVFSDYMCGHCGKFHHQLSQLYEKFPTYFNIEYRHFPHGKALSQSLAKMSICAYDQGQYETFSNHIYSNQKKINHSSIQEYIPTENINLAQFQSCVNSKITEDIIKADLDEVKRLNLNYTPAIFVNGYLSNIHQIRGELNSQLRK